MSYPVTRHTILPFLRKFISQVDGIENLPDKNPFIVAANHTSQTDPLIIIAALFPKYKKKFHYIALRGDFGSIFDHLIAVRWAGCILLDGKNKSHVLEKAFEWLQRGEPVGIFPEGQRTPENRVLKRGKTGIIRLALKARVPIIPIGLITKGERHRTRKGVKRSDPRDAIELFILKGQRVRLKIGKPINLEKYYTQPVTYKLLRKLTDSLMRTLGQLSGQQYPY